MRLPLILNRRRNKPLSLTALIVVVAICGWKLGIKPAMIRAEEWTGTIVAKDTQRPILSVGSSRHRRQTTYYWTVNCGDEEREVEVLSHLYHKAQTGQRVVKVKGERWPRLP